MKKKIRFGSVQSRKNIQERKITIIFKYLKCYFVEEGL